MISPFLERLRRGPILADGATGTMLYAAGISYSRCFEELNLSEREPVLAIHRRYLEAGAELIETNTYSANRFKLAHFGFDDRVRRINLQGVKLAREAREIAGETALVAGAMGPTGLALDPSDRAQVEAIAEAFREQAGGLLEGGADLLILETFGDLNELCVAVRAAQAVSDLPVLAQVALAEDGRTLAGQEVAEVVTALEDLGVAALGANCNLGPQGLHDAVMQMRALTKLPVSVMPNAGLPAYVGGRFIYVSTPAYFADYARVFLQAGVTIVGGCCGTTPEHVAAMRGVVREFRPAAEAERPRVERRGVVLPGPPREEAAPSAPPTTLAQRLAQGKFVVSVELDPPRGSNPGKVLAGARLMREVGVDCVNIADSPMARVRMSCLAMAYLVQQQTGLETIIHFTTRDRNLMALQSDLLGAHAIGVRNVLALSGDPPSLGSHLKVTGVWDVDSIGLIRILANLNAGQDLAGTSVGRPTNFLIGCSLNPNAPDMDKELVRFHQKLEAGAHFVMTQPFYEVSEWERLLRLSGAIPVPVLAGIMPLQSARHAEYLHNEVPGITIPESARRRMREAGEHGVAEGIAMARDLLDELQHHVQGIYLMPSFGRYEMVGEIVRVLKHWHSAPAQAVELE